MCFDEEAWLRWNIDKPIDPRLLEVEKTHNEILNLKKTLEVKKEDLKEMVLDLERKQYNGLTYKENLKKLQSEPVVKGDINVKVVGEMIYGEYAIQEPNRKIVLGYDVNIQMGEI